MVKRRPTEFTIAFATLARRLSWLSVACLLFWATAQLPFLPDFAELRGHTDSDDDWIERIGSPAIVYDGRAYDILPCDTGSAENVSEKRWTKPLAGSCGRLDDDSLDYDVRIEVLDSGLIEGRGLAYDRDRQRLIIADAWGSLYGYWPEYPRLHPDGLPPLRVCPDGHCQDIDRRGVAYDPDTDKIVVTEYDQHRLALRLHTGEFVRQIGGNRLLDGVTDVILAERGAFFVSATGEGSPTADAPQKGAGTVYHVTDEDAKPIVTGLRRPIGLAYSPCQKRLYIADSSPDALTLYFFMQDQHLEWQRAGALATLPADRTAPPAPLSGMTVAGCPPDVPGSGRISAGGDLFVAGPGGLFLFHPDGTLLAKFLLSERVTALAWDEWKPQLYMTVGHRIARLHTRVGAEPLATRRPQLTPGGPVPTGGADSPGPSAPVTGDRRLEPANKPEAQK
jgi:gluconolactonase